MRQPTTKWDNRSTKIGQPIYKNGRTDIQKWDDWSTKIGQPIYKNKTTDLQKLDKRSKKMRQLIYKNRTTDLQNETMVLCKFIFPIEIMVTQSILPICQL
jgi:hypothetical protein